MSHAKNWQTHPTQTRRMVSVWVQVQQAFREVPAANGMTYTEHLVDTGRASLVAAVHLVGMATHAVFPMVGDGCEHRLRDHLILRQAQRQAAQTAG